MPTLAQMLMNRGSLTEPDASVVTPGPQYVPEETLSRQSILANLLRDQAPATSWAGVAAKALGAVGGNIVEGDANNARASNQALRQQSLKDFSAAKDVNSASTALINAQDPALQGVGVQTRVKQLADDPMKEYATRSAVLQKYGIPADSQRGQTFLLTGKLPDTDSPMSVKEWNYFSKLPEGEQQQYLTMKRANQYLDGGTAYTRPNPLNPTAPPVQVVPKDLEGAERAKKTGELGAVGANALPKTRASLESIEATNKLVSDTIDKAVAKSGAWTTGFMGSVSGHIPGSASNDLRATLETIKANLGFEKLTELRKNSPTGGALGSVSEQENKLLQNAMGSVEQSQTREQLISNLREIQRMRAESIQKLRAAYEQDVARFGSANVPNPETGAKGAPISSSPTNALQSARDAIAKGADRNAVIERLKQNGIDPSGL